MSEDSPPDKVCRSLSVEKVHEPRNLADDGAAVSPETQLPPPAPNNNNNNKSNNHHEQRTEPALRAVAVPNSSNHHNFGSGLLVSSTPKQAAQQQQQDSTVLRQLEATVSNNGGGDVVEEEDLKLPALEEQQPSLMDLQEMAAATDDPDETTATGSTQECLQQEEESDAPQDDGTAALSTTNIINTTSASIAADASSASTSSPCSTARSSGNYSNGSPNVSSTGVGATDVEQNEPSKAFESERSDHTNRGLNATPKLLELASADAVHSFIRQNAATGGCIVAFSALWCKPCMEIKPALEVLASQQTANTMAVAYESDVGAALPKLGVRCFPTFILFDARQQEAARVEGANLERVRAELLAGSTMPETGGETLGRVRAGAADGAPQSTEAARALRLAKDEPPTKDADGDTEMKDSAAAAKTDVAAAKDEEEEEEEEVSMEDPCGKLDPGLLKILTESMGFSQLSAQKGLLFGNGGTVEGAVEWLTQHVHQERPQAACRNAQEDPTAGCIDSNSNGAASQSQSSFPPGTTFQNSHDSSTAAALSSPAMASDCDTTMTMPFASAAASPLHSSDRNSVQQQLDTPAAPTTEQESATVHSSPPVHSTPKDSSTATGATSLQLVPVMKASDPSTPPSSSNHNNVQQQQQQQQPAFSETPVIAKWNFQDGHPRFHSPQTSFALLQTAPKKQPQQQADVTSYNDDEDGQQEQEEDSTTSKPPAVEQQPSLSTTTYDESATAVLQGGDHGTVLAAAAVAAATTTTSTSTTAEEVAAHVQGASPRTTPKATSSTTPNQHMTAAAAAAASTTSSSKPILDAARNSNNGSSRTQLLGDDETFLIDAADAEPQESPAAEQLRELMQAAGAPNPTDTNEIGGGTPPKDILDGDDEAVLPRTNAVDPQVAALAHSTTTMPIEGALSPATTTAQNSQDMLSKAATHRQLQPETPRAEHPMAGGNNLNTNVSPADTIVSYDSYESETGECFHHSVKQQREDRNRRQRESMPIHENKAMHPQQQASGANMPMFHQETGSSNSPSLTSSSSPPALHSALHQPPSGPTLQQEGTLLSMEDPHSNSNNSGSRSPSQPPSSVPHMNTSTTGATSNTTSTTIHDSLNTVTDSTAPSARSESAGMAFAAASLQNNSAEQQQQRGDETSLNMAVADAKGPETPTFERGTEPGPTSDNCNNNNGSEQRPLQPAPVPGTSLVGDTAQLAQSDLDVADRRCGSELDSLFNINHISTRPSMPNDSDSSSSSSGSGSADEEEDDDEVPPEQEQQLQQDGSDDEDMATHNQEKETDNCFGSPTESTKAARSDDSNGNGESLQCFGAASNDNTSSPKEADKLDHRHANDSSLGASPMGGVSFAKDFAILETKEEEAVAHSALKKGESVVYDNDDVEEPMGVACNDDENSAFSISTASGKKRDASGSKNSTATMDEIKDAGISDFCLQSEDNDNDMGLQSSGASKLDTSTATDKSLSNTHSIALTDSDLKQTTTCGKASGKKAASRDADSIPTNQSDPHSGGTMVGTSGKACLFSTPPKEVHTQLQQKDFASPLTPETVDGQVESSSITLISGCAKDDGNKALAPAAAEAKNTSETDVYNDNDDGKSSSDDSSKSSNGEEFMRHEKHGDKLSTPRSSQSSDYGFPALRGFSPSNNSSGTPTICSNGSSKKSPAVNSSSDGSQPSNDDDFDPIIDGLTAYAPPNNSEPRVLMLLENLSKWIKAWSKIHEGEELLRTATTSDQGFSIALVKRDDFKRSSSGESVSTLSSDSDFWDTECTCGIVLKAFFLSSDHFSRDLRKEFKTPDGICSALIKYVRAQIVCAVGDDHDDMEYGEVCLLFSSENNPIQVYVEDPSCCQVTVSMENGTLPPTIFKAESVTTIQKLRQHSDKWTNLPDKLAQVFEKSDLMERHGSLLAGSGAFQEIHDMHGGVQECGAAHVLKGGIYHRSRQSNCVLYCSFGPASASGIGGDAQFHHTSVLALLVEHALNHLDETEDDETSNGDTSVDETGDKIEYKEMLYDLLGKAILESETNVYNSITENKCLEDFCKNTFSLAVDLRIFTQRIMKNYEQNVSKSAKKD